MQRRCTPFEYCNQNGSFTALARVKNLDLQIDINLLLSAVATNNLNFHVFSQALHAPDDCKNSTRQKFNKRCTSSSRYEIRSCNIEIKQNRSLDTYHTFLKLHIVTELQSLFNISYWYFFRNIHIFFLFLLQPLDFLCKHKCGSFMTNHRMYRSNKSS